MSERIKVGSQERFVDSPRGGTMRQVVVVITIDGHRYVGAPESDDAHANKLVIEHARLLKLASGEE